MLEFHHMPDHISIDIPPFVRSLVDRLHVSGFKAYIVGGAIRDFYLQRPVTDWDIATSASPEEVRSVFQDTRNFSLKHETVTLVHQGHHYEVTSFRETQKNCPDIEDDLGRRDFTINAMAYDVHSAKFLDPFEGKADISGKLVKAVGNPEFRFMEDPLRLLRGIRLCVELNFDIEKETMVTIQEMADQLSSIAPERIRDELMKILLCSKPSRGFNILRRSGLLKQVIPELLEGYLKRQNSYHKYTVYRHIMETVDRVMPDPVIRLAALFHDIGKPRVRQKRKDGFHFCGHEKMSSIMGKLIMERLRFSREMINTVSHLVSLHEIYYDKKWSDGAVRRLMRKAGQSNISQLLSLRKADLVAHGIRDDKLDLITDLEQRIGILREGFPLNGMGGLAIGGERVMEILGIEQGTRVGEVLKDLMEKVTENPDLNTFEGLSNLVKKWKGED